MGIKFEFRLSFGHATMFDPLCELSRGLRTNTKVEVIKVHFNQHHDTIVRFGITSFNFIHVRKTILIYHIYTISRFAVAVLWFLDKISLFMS